MYSQDTISIIKMGSGYIQDTFRIHSGYIQNAPRIHILRIRSGYKQYMHRGYTQDTYPRRAPRICILRMLSGTGYMRDTCGYSLENVHGVLCDTWWLPPRWDCILSFWGGLWEEWRLRRKKHYRAPYHRPICTQPHEMCVQLLPTKPQ